MDENTDCDYCIKELEDGYKYFYLNSKSFVLFPTASNNYQMDRFLPFKFN